MSADAATPDLPPGLLEEYLAGMRTTLAQLATLGARLSARGNDREALGVLQRETHKIRGSAGSYGFGDASRLAAGMEMTVRDWAARPDEDDVNRGSLTLWFVSRLAEMLHLPSPEARAVSRPSAARPLPAAPGTPRPPLHPPTAPPRPKTGVAPPVAPVRPPPAPTAVPTTRSAPGPGAPNSPPARVPDQAPSSSPSFPKEPAPRGPALGRESLGRGPGPVSRAASASVGESPAPHPAPAPAASQGAALTVPEVISVEDDASLAELLEYGLRAHGYRFRAYRNGREALRELLGLDVQGTQPLLLLDVDLPALDGYSIFAALQRERPGVYRVVFTTVHGTEEEQLRGLEAGALDYLVKPISLRVALEKIKRWVGR